jgi:hypothetical protein
MKTTFSKLSIAALLLSFFFTETKAQLKLPAPSPKATMTETVGLTDITIEYSRPSAKGSKIMGDLVKYNEIWRTGANKATYIKFSTDVMINDQKLAAGAYSIFTIPTENEWTIIFNKNTELWGTDEYKQDQDALRVNVKPTATEMVETFTISVSNITVSSASIEFAWEKVKVAVAVKTDAETMASNNIKESVGGMWRTYAQAANYYLQNNTNLAEAKTLIDQSISLKPGYYNYWIKAQIMAKQANYKDALASAEKAAELGKVEGGNYKFFSENIEKAIAEYKTKVPATKKK